MSTPASTPRGTSLARPLETAALVVVCAAFLLYAVLSVLYVTRWPATVAGTDFFFRWQEIQYVFRGVDPRDVVQGVAPVDDAVGRPQFTYPPWSYVLGSVLVPPVPAAVALPWFAVLNFAGLAFLAAQAARLAVPFGARARVLLALAAVTSLAVPVTLRHLNYSIVLCAALALYVRCEEKGRPLLAGVALAFLSVKPHFGALFFLVPLFRRSWKTLGIAVLLNLAATAALAAMLSKDPLRLVTAMAAEGATYTDAYLGIFDLLRRAGASTPLVLLLGMTSGLLAAALVLRFHAHQPVRTLVGVVACITTLWSYQRTMDLLVLGFLVCPLAIRAYRSRATVDWIVFVVVGGSYWFPYLVRMAAMPVVPELFRAIWIVGAVHLLRAEAHPAPATPPATRVEVVTAP